MFCWTFPFACLILVQVAHNDQRRTALWYGKLGALTILLLFHTDSSHFTPEVWKHISIKTSGLYSRVCGSTINNLVNSKYYAFLYSNKGCFERFTIDVIHRFVRLKCYSQFHHIQNLTANSEPQIPNYLAFDDQPLSKRIAWQPLMNVRFLLKLKSDDEFQNEH